MKKIKYSFEQWCLDNNHNDLLELWDYQLNDCSPSEVSFQSNKNWYFRCSRGLHQSEKKMLSNVVRRKKVVCSVCKSFGQWLLDNLGDDAIEKYWSCKNTISPFSFSYGRNSQKIWIKCQNKKHPDYEITPNDFTRGTRCPICGHNKCVRGINDIATTHPQHILYLADIEDAYKYTAKSNYKIMFKCPACGYEKNMTIGDFTIYGFSCDRCGDGVSYPNKFMTALLMQLNNIKSFEFTPEKTFYWSKNILCNNIILNGNKRYDFHVVLDGCDIIIECHGIQHYEELGFYSIKGVRSLNDEKENDEIKKQLAIDNGVSPDKYVVIDCRYSDHDFIKNSIMSSTLPHILSFSEDDVDWSLCQKYCCTSLIKEVCDEWMSGNHSLTKLARKFCLSSTTIWRYLKKGSLNGLCNYPINRYNPSERVI